MGLGNLFEREDSLGIHSNAFFFNELLAYIEGKGVAADPERVFTLEKVAQAHAFLQSQNSFGKVIVLDPSARREEASE